MMALKLKSGPKHALQRTRPSRYCCNRTPSWAGSLSLDVLPLKMPPDPEDCTGVPIVVTLCL